jgi:hypothetical protein
MIFDSIKNHTLYPFGPAKSTAFVTIQVNPAPARPEKKVKSRSEKNVRIFPLTPFCCQQKKKAPGILK